MTKVINNYTGVCKNCHKFDQIHTQTDDGCEMLVCYSCGKVEFRKELDALSFITELIEDGIDKKDEILEVLVGKLADYYDQLDFVDVEALAGLLVKYLYDEAMFRAEADKQEAEENEAERSMALADVAAGRW